MKFHARELTLFFTLLLVCGSGHAAEQDNWYLANEWSVSTARDIAYYEDKTSGTKMIYVLNGSHTSSKLSVYEMNGTLSRDVSIANSRYQAFGLELDENGTIYITEEYCVTCLENDGTFKWRTGKGNTSISSYGSGGSGNGEFSYAYEIGISHSGELFVADKGNHRVQVLDQNGSFLRKFGSYGTAPGQLRGPRGLCILQNGNVVVGDEYYLHYFQPDGTFIKRVNASSARYYVSGAKDGTLFSSRHLRDADGNSLQNASFIGHVESRTCFTPEGDLIESHNNKIRIWKRAYRTKGLPVRNVIPQPAVRAITQRAGTNIIDLDFEILDPDDANATVGILAAQDGAFSDTSKWILPQTWVDGTGSKIGTPIATNQVHRVSWNVKPDWPNSTGTLKFEIICHDARRTSPVDLHFITLPLPDGNLTISRSPLKDSDFESYAKFLVAIGATGVFVDINGSIIDNGAQVPNGSTQYIFTNCGASGKDGPTWTEVNASYLGTNLAGSISMTTQGIQEWTVPDSGTYVVEAAGAMGGRNPNANGDFGYGAYARGKFNLSVGDKLKILVGQMGLNSTSNNSGGGGGTFVTTDSDIPLIIAGGGGGSKGNTRGGNGLDGANGGNAGSKAGGINGGAGNSEFSRGGGGGLTGSANGSNGGKAFVNGGEGGGSYGGFGGGGSGHYNDSGGGGGGYSGGSTYNSQPGGGGGSFNADVNGSTALGSNLGHGKVVITRVTNSDMERSIPQIILTKNMLSTGVSPELVASRIGYRIATPEEVQKAREAATAGGVNQWTANRPVQPRNLPYKVNEYGFDTGNHGDRAWWIVQE